MKSLFRHLARHWVALCAVLAVLLLSSSAFAYGRVQWKKTRVKENVVGTQSNWKLEMDVYLPKPPDFAHVPVKFEFKQSVYYERFRDDSHPEPQVRKVPTPNSQAIIESVDLGFLDPGTGKIQSRTRFAFKITRAHGFDAGEYRVTIRNARTGATLGTPVTLYLEGENEVIDRRAMVFADKKEKDDDKEKAEEEAADEDAEPEDPMSTEGSMDYEEVTDDEAPLPPPEPLKSKRGCGCRTVGVGGSSGGALALSLLLGVGILARRRRRV
jgi:MYXO-CTERM domain-containing protein